MGAEGSCGCTKPVQTGVGDFHLPKDHLFGMVVKKGGSSCANCQFGYAGHCSNPYFQAWQKTLQRSDPTLLPAPADEYCCDVWSQAPHVSRPTAPARAQENPIGRQVRDGVLREPLLAVAESLVIEGADEPFPENNVYACGECCEDSGATPAVIRFDTYKRNPLEAVYERTPGAEHELPKKLQDAYAQRVPSCIPFVRVTRDPALFRQCLASARAMGRIDDSEKVYQLVGEHLAKEDQEVFLVILLDVQLQVRGVSELARGGRDQVSVPIPDVLRVSIIEGASGFVVVHNHPSGNLAPSEADKMLTKSLKEAAEKVRLQLLDHVIVSVNGHYSFAKHDLL